MISSTEFMQLARSRYIAANQAALYWQVARMEPSSPLIDTKFNGISLQDYTAQDGWRGPDFVYGWIQGRGLEAMVLHSEFFQSRDAALSRQLQTKARELYTWLNTRIGAERQAFFCYNSSFEPVCVQDSSRVTLQKREEGIATYTDLFVVKGLIAAAARYFPEDIPAHLRTLQSIIDAIDNQRFLLSESSHITESALVEQADDYGPKMIALGAASLLHAMGLQEHDSFSLRFIESILDNHHDAGSGLLRTAIGGDACNVGHSVEFAGFSLETHGKNLPPEIANSLAGIITAGFNHGFNGVGLVLTIDLSTLATTSSVCPWWSLPETIRATSLAFEYAQGNSQMNAQALMQIWQQSHDAFFDHYWRDDPPIAYQTLSKEGPVDYVPATPDLDPGYHTGLSLLAAIEMVDRQNLVTSQT